MGIDKLFDLKYNGLNGASKTHDVGRGRLNGLLIKTPKNSGSGNEITVKVRGKNETHVLANNTDLHFFAGISDREFGLRVIDSQATVLGNILTMLNDHVDFTVNDWLFDINTSRAGGVYVDLGHITLGDVELEVELDVDSTGTDEALEASCYMVYNETKPDVYYQYDATNDFDTTYQSLREVFLFGNSPLVTDAGGFKDINIQIDHSDGTLITDISGAMASSNIFSRTEYPQTKIVSLYKEVYPTPESARIKLTGGDVNSTDLTLLIKREVVPQTVSDSTKNNLKKIRQRVEELEAKNAELAKRYRHAGKIQKSEEMAEVEEEMENSEGKKGSNSE